MTALSDALAKARAEDRAALIAYLPVGYPSVDVSIDAMRAMVDGGADVVEVGVPYSDPVIDGPTIQAAAEPAVRAGASIADALRAVAAVRQAGAAAVVMSYWNPIDRYGVERFAADLAAAGGSGAITPDLIPDEAGPWLAATDEHGLDRIFLVAPSSTDARIAATAAASRGFVYAASTMGVTGARTAVGGAAEALVKRVRDPVARLARVRRSGCVHRRPGRRSGWVRRRGDRRRGAGAVSARLARRRRRGRGARPGRRPRRGRPPPLSPFPGP